MSKSKATQAEKEKFVSKVLELVRSTGISEAKAVKKVGGVPLGTYHGWKSQLGMRLHSKKSKKVPRKKAAETPVQTFHVEQVAPESGKLKVVVLSGDASEISKVIGELIA